MPRRSKGYAKTAIKVRGKWYGRLRITLPNGKHKDYWRQGINKTNARQKAEELEAEYLAGGSEAMNAREMTFSGLCAEFRAKKLIDPVYLGERKVAGYKHKEKLNGHLRRLEKYWGASLLHEITLPKIEDFKLYLIRKPTKRGGQISAYDVNNQLRALRLVLNFAKKNRWIQTNPFEFADKLINVADEIPRDRPEKDGELEQLLAACTGRRLHIRYWILCSIETAARTSEVDRITREDLLWDEGVIRLRVSTTKTQQERFVPITALLGRELREWLDIISTSEYWSRRIPDTPDARIFGPQTSNEVGFANAVRDAGLVNLMRRDLRHWGTTRLVDALAKAGLSDKHGMKITGHTVEKTFRRYLRTDKEIVRAAGAALDELRRLKDRKPETSHE